jgi:hypothetical protein
MDGLEKNLRSLGVVNWNIKAQERDGWRKFLDQAETTKCCSDDDDDDNNNNNNNNLLSRCLQVRLKTTNRVFVA